MTLQGHEQDGCDGHAILPSTVVFAKTCRQLPPVFDQGDLGQQRWLDFEWATGAIFAMPLQPKRWNAGFSALLTFKKREGHFLVPRHHIEAGFPLGQWVTVQRYWLRIGCLPANRKARLNSVGFVWSRREWLWERAFAALQKFKRREGHCRVPALHIEDEINLGYWVSVQRRMKNKMSRDRKRRLDKIGFVWRGHLTG